MLAPGLEVQLSPDTVQGVGTPFSPTDLGASLLAWWNADRLDLITFGVGSAVAGWADISTGIGMNQVVVGQQPIYGAASFNGSPGITFDAVDDFLGATAGFPAAIPTGIASGEYWFLVDQPLPPSNVVSGAMMGLGNNGNARRLLGRSSIAGVNRIFAQVGNVTNLTLYNGAVNDFSGRHVVRFQVDAVNAGISIDGVPDASGPVLTGTNSGNSNFRFGCTANTVPSVFYGGTFREVVITGPLSVGQAASLETYLFNRRNP